MAYDEDLAARVRDVLADDPTLTEKSMFGGRAFLVHDSMAVAVGPEDMLVRVGADQVGELVESTPARQAVMGGRVMRNWMEIDASDVVEDQTLAEWVERGAAAARSVGK